MSSTGRIHRSKVSDNFTIIKNDILTRNDMSWAAKGLLSYLLSLPPDWKIYKSEVVKMASNGKDSTETAWKELQQKGYIVAGKMLKDKGKFGGRDFIVFDVVQEDHVGKPAADNPQDPNREIRDGSDAEKPQLLSTNNTQSTKTKKFAGPTDPAYVPAMAAYNDFCLLQTGTSAKIDGAQGDALKKILAYLRLNSHDKSVDGVVNGLKYIFANWKSLDAYHQSQLKLTQINSNLINIINQLRNGKATGSTADVLRQIDEMARQQAAGV